jgi:protein-tyrosine-phosphatase
MGEETMKKKVLFLCSGNSARSIMAQELLRIRGGDKFEAFSAGTRPEREIHPMTVEALGEIGVSLDGRKPLYAADLADKQFDIILTLCDEAREECPVFPGHPIRGHWGMPDPAEAEGSEENRLQAFRRTLREIGNRIDLFVLLETDRMGHEELERLIGDIGDSCG